MLPAPIRPIRMRARRIWVAPAGPGSGLVEEALLYETGALLRGDLDVARREQEDLVGDPLHAAVERVGEARGEVDETLRELRVRALEIEDHRHGVLELVRHLLGVVEALRYDQVHLHAAAAATAVAVDRPQHARGAAGRARGLVGEDVVDLVAAPPALEAADVRSLAVAGLELLLGLGLSLLAVAVVLLGEAEVDEHVVPGIP